MGFHFAFIIHHQSSIAEAIVGIVDFCRPLRNTNSPNTYAHTQRLDSEREMASGRKSQRARQIDGQRDTYTGKVGERKPNERVEKAREG